MRIQPCGCLILQDACGRAVSMAALGYMNGLRAFTAGISSRIDEIYIMQPRNPRTISLFPRNDAQVLEVALAIRIKLHRRHTPHIIERIVSLAEYWPSLQYVPDDAKTAENRFLKRPDIVPIGKLPSDPQVKELPENPPRRALKIHLRFCVGCTQTAHDPEAHVAAGQALWRYRPAAGSSVNEPRSSDVAQGILAGELKQFYHFKPYGLMSRLGTYIEQMHVQREPQALGRTGIDDEAGGWFDDAFYTDAAMRSDALLHTRFGRCRRRTALSLAFQPQGLTAGPDARIEAVVFLEPWLDFNRLMVLRK